MPRLMEPFKQKLVLEKLQDKHRDEAAQSPKDLSNWLSRYTKEMDEIQNKNRRLQEELSFDQNTERENPFHNHRMADKLSSLYMQGNNVMIRLEAKKQELLGLNRRVRDSEAQIEQSKSKSLEITIFRHQKPILIGKIRNLEHELDRRVLKMNERLQANQKLRARINEHQQQRANMDALYVKQAFQILQKQQQAAKLSRDTSKLQSQINIVEETIEEFRKNGGNWEHQCDQRAIEILQELKQFCITHTPSDVRESTPVGEPLPQPDLAHTIPHTAKNALRSRVTRSRWKTGQSKLVTSAMLEKYQENRQRIEEALALTRTKTVPEFIRAFELEEAEYFHKLQNLNRLAQAMEDHRMQALKLRDHIARLKEKESRTNITQRQHHMELIKEKLHLAIGKKRARQASMQEIETNFQILRPGILQFHAKIESSQEERDSNDGALGKDVDQCLSELKDRILFILQEFQAKCGGPTSPNTASARIEHTVTNISSAQRYEQLQMPQLTMEDLRRRDKTEDEYILTYQELKSSVCRGEGNSPL